MENQPEWSKIDMRISKKESKRSSDYVPKKLKKTNKYKNKEGRFVNTREYAIAWGVINKPYSEKDLFNKCKDSEAPSYHYIMFQEWKGYSPYYKTLIKAGMPPRPPKTDMEKRKYLGKIEKKGFKTGILQKDYQIAKLTAQLGIKTKKQYSELRKQKPELKAFLPDAETIVRRFQTWKRFMYQVMKYDADLVLTEYVKKSFENNRWLKLSECDKLKIPIRGIMNILRPSLFNALCYKKLELINNGKKRFNNNKEQK